MPGRGLYAYCLVYYIVVYATPIKHQHPRTEIKFDQRHNVDQRWYKYGVLADLRGAQDGKWRTGESQLIRPIAG